MSEYSEASRTLMLQAAAASIRYGVEHGQEASLQIDDYPKELREPRASFVTLQITGQLRGCIGSLQAHQALILDVSHNAYAAAFADPRFGPLQASEYPRLELHISILSVPEPLEVMDEAHLLGLLRPGVDGLILEDGPYRATFLPSVWEQLPRPAEFLGHLKRKAGMRPGYWSENLQVQRYTTESFGSAVSELG